MNQSKQELTLEQAFSNIAIAIERDFVGKKQEHIALEQSLLLIKKMIDEKSIEKSAED